MVLTLGGSERPKLSFQLLWLLHSRDPSVYNAPLCVLLFLYSNQLLSRERKKKILSE